MVFMQFHRAVEWPTRREKERRIAGSEPAILLIKRPFKNIPTDIEKSEVGEENIGHRPLSWPGKISTPSEIMRFI